MSRDCLCLCLFVALYSRPILQLYMYSIGQNTAAWREFSFTCWNSYGYRLSINTRTSVGRFVLGAS